MVCFKQVEQTTDAGGLALLDQLRDPAGHEHGLHVALGLREIEQLAAIGVAAHLDEPLRLVVADVRERSGRNIDVRVALPPGQPRPRRRPAHAAASSFSRHGQGVSLP